MTHESVMLPTSRWPLWAEAWPAIAAAVRDLLRVFMPHCAPEPGPWALVWGVDVAVDGWLRPFIFEVNTAPLLTYGEKFPAWQSVVERMMSDFVAHFVVPYLTQRPAGSDRGGWMSIAEDAAGL